MTENIKLFLKESSIAEKVKLPTCVIVHRTRLSSKEIIQVKKQEQQK